MSDQSGRDLYQWDGSDAGAPQQGRDDGGASTRFRDEVYDPHQRHGYPPGNPGYPREYYQPGRPGGDNVNMIVYGDVYINQGDNCGRSCQRPDGRREYYGRNYDYQQYCAPQWRQAVPYQEYGYRMYGSGGQQMGRSGYDYYGGYYDRPGYSYGGDQRYYRQEPNYSRDSVRGGRDGYSADRERYQGGYETYGSGGRSGPRPYYEGGCFGGGGYGSGPAADGWDRAGQVFDFALRGADAYFGYDIARRHAKGQYSGGGRGGGYDRGGYGGGGDRYDQWRQHRQRQQEFHYRR